MTMMLSALEERLRIRARRDRQPLSCAFELTPTCNLRCHFCYVALDPYEGPYLATEQIFTVLDRLERAGVLWLVLTGGEVFSRRDFPEIYRYAKAKGFLVTLYTNATMVTEARAAMLRELPPHSVEVSIYGADAEHYEGTTGIPGSFGRFERGVELLQRAGVALMMKAPLSSFNVDHVPAILEWCRSRGLPFKYDSYLDNRHSGTDEPSQYRIAPERLTQLTSRLHQLEFGDVPPGPLAECSAVAPADGPEELYKCGAGRVGFFVDALGNASHCVIDREPSFPLLSMEWDDVWSRIGEWVTQPLPAEAPCSGCSLRRGCGNCPARARLATGSPYLKDTYACDITHVRHGLPVAQHPDYRRAPRPLGACTVNRS